MSELHVGDSQASFEAQRNRPLAALATACVVISFGILLSAYLSQAEPRPQFPEQSMPIGQLELQVDSDNVKTPPVDMVALRKQAWERIKGRLDEADKASAAEINKRLGVFSDFMRERRAGTVAFAKAVLSLRGKWEFIKAKLPFTDEEDHRNHLRSEFEKHVFSSSELKTEIERVVSSYVSNVEGIENELLVAIRADVDNFAKEKAVSLVDGEVAFKSQFREAVNEVTPVVAQELRKDLAIIVGSEIAMRIASRVAIAVCTRLGVSAGILTAGTLGSWKTFGLSIVAAVILDEGIDLLLRLAGDEPEREVAQKVNTILEGIEANIVHGYPGAHQALNHLREKQTADPEPDVQKESRLSADSIEMSGNLGLGRELYQLNKVRATVRREALRKVILEVGRP